MTRTAATALALPALCLAAWLAVAGQAEAATQLAVGRVGFINLVDVQEKATPVRQQIDAATKSIEELEAQADAKTQQLADLRKQSRNASVLSKEEQSRIAGEIEKVQEEIDDLSYRIRREMSKVEDKTISSALDLIVNAIDAVAKQQGYTLILKSESVVYGDPSCDITNAVIEHLNASASAKPAAAAPPKAK